jgi:hypothetical protein
MSSSPEKISQQIGLDNSPSRRSDPRLVLPLLCLLTLSCSGRLSVERQEQLRQQIEANERNMADPPVYPTEAELEAFKKEYVNYLILAMLEEKLSPDLEENQVMAVINRVLNSKEETSYITLQSAFANADMVAMLKLIANLRQSAEYEAQALHFPLLPPNIGDVISEDPTAIVGQEPSPASFFLEMSWSMQNGEKKSYLPLPWSETQAEKYHFYSEQSQIILARDRDKSMHYSLVLPYGDDAGQLTGCVFIELNSYNFLDSQPVWLEFNEPSLPEKIGTKLQDLLALSAKRDALPEAFRRNGYYPIRMISVDEYREIVGDPELKTWSFSKFSDYVSDTATNSAPGTDLAIWHWFQDIDDSPIDYQEILLTSEDPVRVPVMRFTINSKSTNLSGADNDFQITTSEPALFVAHGDVVPIGASTEKEYQMGHLIFQGEGYTVLSLVLTNQIDDDRMDYLFEVFAVNSQYLLPYRQPNQHRRHASIEEMLNELWGTNRNREEMEIFVPDSLE